ncbi:MAG: diguanylate cyclase [Lachnospiraceae bacterium]|nr:diguanylate cyclase [Lachnospiraceae bacterium]
MDNQNRSSVLQWLLPTGIMLVVVVIMLFRFWTKSGTESENSVFKTLISSTESYASSFLHELEKTGKAGEPISVLLGDEGTADSARVAELLEVTADCANVEKVFYSDINGVGIDQTGTSVELGQESWFEDVRGSESSYIYVQEEQAIIVTERVNTDKAQGYLLMFYPLSKFSSILLNSGYDSSSFLAIVDMNGGVLSASGATSNACLKDGNILTTIEGENREAAKSLRGRMNNGSRGNVYIKMNKQKQLLTFVPVGAPGWDMVLGVSEAYVDRQIGYLRKNTNNMIMSLLLVIVIFFCTVMVINIVGKIRSNEKKKELEDKADTDLLTGLNNKLATERKIKEYMAKHPDKQSMMFILDIDNFKKINDTMGHAFGDEVLRSLGTQIGSIFRATDIIGRVGGDEFMVFLKDIPNDETILKEARKVEEFFKNFQAGEYVKYKATASIGVAVFPQEGAEFEALYKAADQGLYKAKKRGKNQLAFYRDRTPAGQEQPQAEE